MDARNCDAITLTHYSRLCIALIDSFTLREKIVNFFWLTHLAAIVYLANCRCLARVELLLSSREICSVWLWYLSLDFYDKRLWHYTMYVDILAETIRYFPSIYSAIFLIRKVLHRYLEQQNHFTLHHL